MQLGIIGLPNSGKTTVFNALTGSHYETGAVSSGKLTVNTAVVDVPDPRVDSLSQLFNPKKTTYATITYQDVGGLDKGIGDGGLPGPLRNALAPLDGFVHVVRVFQDDTVPHPLVDIDPARDLSIIDTEFMLTDLITIEARLEKLHSEVAKKGKKQTGRSTEDEAHLLSRLKTHLESDQPLRDMADELTPEEHQALRGFGLLSLKPVVVVLNVAEPLEAPNLAYNHCHSVVLSLAGQIEAEIAQLDATDRAEFLADYGIAEPGAKRVIRASYALFNILTFFTVGEDEVRAWTVKAGATAPQAAGVIHSDLQRGFIRAEVVAYEDFMAAGSLVAAKAGGRMRLEGKTYVAADGDIMNIRFSV